MFEEVHDEKKLVAIWLSRAEAADGSVRASLTPLYERYRQKKYRVAVFSSGAENLTDATAELLRHARETAARASIAP